MPAICQVLDSLVFLRGMVSSDASWLELQMCELDGERGWNDPASANPGVSAALSVCDDGDVSILRGC